MSDRTRKEVASKAEQQAESLGAKFRGEELCYLSIIGSDSRSNASSTFYSSIADHLWRTYTSENIIALRDQTDLGQNW